jgi:hypothetical protein
MTLTMIPKNVVCSLRGIFKTVLSLLLATALFYHEFLRNIVQE